jgi:CheY-like chemotaxis protein
MNNLSGYSKDSRNAKPPRRQQADGRPLVLVVDDHEDTRDLIKFVLEKQGYRIVEAEDGEVAIERGTHEHPDIVLMDLALPKIDGLGVMEQLRGRADLKDMPILFISAHAEKTYREQALAAGGDEYLIKPLDLDQLLRVLDRYISKRKSKRLDDGK